MEYTCYKVIDLPPTSIIQQSDVADENLKIGKSQGGNMKKGMLLTVGLIVLLLAGVINVRAEVASDSLAGIISHVAGERNAASDYRRASSYLVNSHHGVFSTYVGFGVLIESDDYDSGDALGYVIDGYDNIIGVHWADGYTYYFFSLNLITRDLYGCPFHNCGSSDYYYLGKW
jgi:hypothetical protein